MLVVFVLKIKPAGLQDVHLSSSFISSSNGLSLGCGLYSELEWDAPHLPFNTAFPVLPLVVCKPDVLSYRGSPSGG